MKTTIKQFSFALVLALTTILTSCSSSDGGGSGGFNGPAAGTFVKAKVAGSDFLGEGAYATGAYNSGNLRCTFQLLVHHL